MARHQRLVFVALLALVLALLFGATMQRDINGSNDTYVIDTGEFQNVAAQWGTGHPTGYPLYSLTVAAFANGLRLVGVPPALGGSVLSVALAILTLVGLAIFLGRLGVAPPLAAVAALVPAVTLAIWVFAVVADVRAMLLFLLVAAYRGNWAPEFLSSLPIVALDGTMRRRLHDSPAAGRGFTRALRPVHRAFAGAPHDGAVAATPRPKGTQTP